MRSIKFSVLLFALVFLMISCGPTIYMAPNFDRVKSKHETLAILPFNVNISTKSLPKNVSVETIREDEEKTGYSIQGHAYSYFLKEQSKNKYSVSFQDIDKTNSLLLKSGLDYNKIREYGKDELCKMLDVDAIISGNVSMDKPMSDGGAIAVGVLFGVWTTTNKVNVNMTIHDRDKGDLLWKYDWVAEGSVGSSSEQLTKGLMRNVSKKFPYQRTK